LRGAKKEDSVQFSLLFFFFFFVFNWLVLFCSGLTNLIYGVLVFVWL